ncbi:MAG: PAS domain-containing protein [Hyphomicrobium sp.]
MPTTSHKARRERPRRSSPHDIPSGPEKAAGAGEEPLAALARVIAALQPNTDLILEQKKQLEELNSRFEVALNNMGRGLSMFDAQARLIVCNELYSEIYGLPDELTRPGTTLAQIVRFHVNKETGRDDPAELEKQRKWIENHVAELARGKSFAHTQHLKSGRIVLVSNQPLASGGWVDIQEDITEKRLAEQKIDWLARHDTLTEIANRHHFREQL